MSLPAQQPQSPTGPLVHIPVEVLLRITSFLSTVELGNVRLTCRSLEQSLFHFFSHEFFRKKQFMVFSDSLQALIDISKHPALSRVLTHVIIATDTLSVHAFPSPHAFDANDLTKETYFFNQSYLAHADQSHLLSGGLKDMLAEAFRNLPNLEILDIRDFNSSTRNRDGEGARWSSYGSKTLASRVSATGDGITLENSTGRPRFPDEIFKAAVAALAEADARLRQIHINIRSSRLGHVWSLTEEAFYIPPRLEAPLQHILGGLTTLHLALHTNDMAYLRGPKVGPFLLHRFLSFTPNLTWLRLNMSPLPPIRSEVGPPWERVFKWIINGSTKAQEHDFSPYETQPISFPKLEQLDIGNVMVAEKTLLQLVGRLARSLKTLSLRRVTLMPHHDTDDEENPTPWVHFFQRMTTLEGIDIREINLAFLHDGSSSHPRSPSWVRNDVDFVAHKGPNTQRIRERSFQGTSTAAIVKQILLDIYVPAAPIIQQKNSSDESSNSDEESDSGDDLEMDVD